MTAFTIERVAALTEFQVTFMPNSLNVTIAKYTDPFKDVMTEGDPDLSYLRWRAAILATLLEGELWVLKIEGGQKKIVSCGSWFAPGTGLFRTEEQRKLGYTDFLKRVSPAVKEWMKNVYGPQVTQVMNGIFSPKDNERLWWVSSLATDPSHQGRGFASSIMRILLQKVAKDKKSRTFVGLAASPWNTPFYKSLGFKVEGSGDISSPVEGKELLFDVLTKLRS